MPNIKDSKPKVYFDFKNEESREKFIEDMRTSYVLQTCFLNEKPFKIQCSNFFNKLKKMFHKSFKKIKVKKRVRTGYHGDPKIQAILEKKKSLRK